MFTFINLYIFAYVLTLIWFFYYIFVFKFLNFIAQNSFANFWSSVNRYSNYNLPLIFLLLQLSGLPPFFFFAIKLNFLLLTINKAIFIIQFLVFLNILLNCFFYLKIFMSKDTKISNANLKAFAEEHDMLSNNSYRYNKRKYKFIYWFSSFIILNALSMIWFADVYYTVFYWFIFLKK